MDTKTLIDNLIFNFLDIGNTSANQPQLRTRCLFHIQQVVDEIFYFRPWPWRIAAPADVVVGGASSGSPGFAILPPDFINWVAVDNKAARYKLEYMSPARLFDLRERETGTDSRPRWFTISDQDQAQGGVQIHLHKIPTGASITVQLTYERGSPILVDSAVNFGGLAFIPPQFHTTVLYEGAVARLMEDEGDGRSPLQMQKYRRRLMEMWASQKPTINAARRGPRYAAALLGRRLWR